MQRATTASKAWFCIKADQHMHVILVHLTVEKVNLFAFFIVFFGKCICDTRTICRSAPSSNLPPTTQTRDMSLQLPLQLCKATFAKHAAPRPGPTGSVPCGPLESSHTLARESLYAEIVHRGRGQKLYFFLRLGKPSENNLHTRPMRCRCEDVERLHQVEQPRQ